MADWFSSECPSTMPPGLSLEAPLFAHCVSPGSGVGAGHYLYICIVGATTPGAEAAPF